METVEKKKRFYSALFFQVVVGIALGVVIGLFVDLHFVEAYVKPLGNGFIKLIRAMIGPIIFGTVVVGVANMGGLKKVLRIGVKSFVYFEVVTTMALAIGLVVAHLFQPGAGINADPAQLDVSQISRYTAVAKNLSTMDFFMNIIPTTVMEAFTKGEILQVLFIAVLFGIGLNAMGQKGKQVVRLIDGITHGFFQCAHYIMKLAPIGAGAAFAYAISKYGTGTLTAMFKLLLGVWGAAFLFVVVILGLICNMAGFSIWRLILYIKEEALIAWGTASSETVLPRLLAKLENSGIQKSVVGVVVPAGYNFNLDGTSIYLAVAALFIAQAFNVHLTWGQELTIIAVLMLTSKGAAAMAGGTFICLAATLSSFEVLPLSGLVLLLGVDWFMASCRALINMIGNAVATVIVARWENAIDLDRFKRVLYNQAAVNADEPEMLTEHRTDARPKYPSPLVEERGIYDYRLK